VLPPALRWASLAAAGILYGAAWVALARADLVAPGAEPLGISIATWCFAAYFSLNVAGNLLSQSTLERAVMTPVAALLALCFITLAFS
jgi:hypothetical protein